MATVIMPAWATMKMFAGEFSASATYAVDAWVSYQGEAWKCHTAVETAGSWTGATNWTKVPLAELMGDISDKVNILVSRQCEIVVTCVTQDGVTVTGQTVTLRAGTTADSPIYDTRAYNGQPVTFSVPKDFRYFVEVSSMLSGHFNPTTATGTASANTTNVMLSYSDISNISIFADLQAALATVTTQTEGRAAFVGLQIADTWTDIDGITVYNDPKIVQDVQPVLDPAGNTHLAAIVMPKYCTKYTCQFDAAESGAAGYATEATARAGIYYFGYGKAYDATKTYAVNAWVSFNGGIFKCTTAVSSAEAFDISKWSLQDAVFYSAEKTYAVGDYAKIRGKAYQCNTAIAEPEEFDETKWDLVLSSSGFKGDALANVSLSAGATIDYTAYAAWYHTDVASGNKDYFLYGYNNWEMSAIRQYLNSDADIGEWWNPAHVGDCPPSQLNSIKGYKAGCTAAYLAAAKPIRVPCYPWNKSPMYTIDTFFLPSGTEMFGSVNENEGYAFKKVADNCNSISGWTTANNNSTNARVYKKVNATGTSADCWLRSASRSTSNSVCYVNTGGNINYYHYAYASLAALPACAIY